MPSTNLTFKSREEHRRWLASQATLPEGFRVGTAQFDFVPREAPKPAKMTLTLIACDRPTPDFAAVFTRNAIAGAPVLVGRRRLREPRIGAIIVNNKISNVCAPGGEEAAESICAAVATGLGFRQTEVLPSSTGVIGWALPVEKMLESLPAAVSSLSAGSIIPAAEGIVTTDLFPKVRRFDLAGGASIVGIAKGAGMIEPNLATLLVYVLTDAQVPREKLRALLGAAAAVSFNAISVDSDMSTSDTLVAISSGRKRCDEREFERGLTQVCRDLAEDVVRNGEGVRHVMRVRVANAPDGPVARAVAKSVVNAPLFKCAVAGNDPNVGRLIQAIGKFVGVNAPTLDLRRMKASIGGIEIYSGGLFRLDPQKEEALARHLRGAELYSSAPPKAGVFAPPVDYPAHERCVEIAIDLGSGSAADEILGGDLTHEYVSENADYRS